MRVKLQKDLKGRQLIHHSTTITVTAKQLPLFAVACTLLEVPPLPVISLQGDRFMGSPTIRPINPLPESAVNREEKTLIADVVMTVYNPALKAIVNKLDPGWRFTRLMGEFAQ